MYVLSYTGGFVGRQRGMYAMLELLVDIPFEMRCMEEKEYNMLAELVVLESVRKPICFARILITTKVSAGVVDEMN